MNLMIPDDLRVALADLVHARLDWADASKAFLAELPGGDLNDEKAKALERAHLAMADAGMEVAGIAIWHGIQPTVNDEEFDPEPTDLNVATQNVAAGLKP